MTDQPKPAERLRGIAVAMDSVAKWGDNAQRAADLRAIADSIEKQEQEIANLIHDNERLVGTNADLATELNQQMEWNEVRIGNLPTATVGLSAISRITLVASRYG